MAGERSVVLAVASFKQGGDFSRPVIFLLPLRACKQSEPINV